jgi:hypothetical protein
LTPPIMGHAHHIQRWADGGETSLGNMILVCGHHHRRVHNGPWQISRNGAGLFVFDPPPGVRRVLQATRPPPDG